MEVSILSLKIPISDGHKFLCNGDQEHINMAEGDPIKSVDGWYLSKGKT